MRRGHDGAAEFDLPAPDERQREVRQRGEVARRADAPLLGDDRMDAEREELEEPVDDQRPAAAVAEGERVGPQQEHRPHDLARERRPHARRVAHRAGAAGARAERSGGTNVVARSPNPVVTP